MIAMGYARFNGFGYAFGDDQVSCASEGKFYDPNSDSCMECAAGYVYSTADGNCYLPGTAPSGGSKPAPGGGGTPAPAPGGGGGPLPGTSTASATTHGMLPWVVGGAALLGIVYFASKAKRR